MFPQPSLVRLRAIGWQTIVFVQEKQLDAAKVQGLLAVQTDQFSECSKRGRSGWHADDGALAQGGSLADQPCHDVSGIMREFLDGIKAKGG